MRDFDRESDWQEPTRSDIGPHRFCPSDEDGSICADCEGEEDSPQHKIQNDPLPDTQIVPVDDEV